MAIYTQPPYPVECENGLALPELSWMIPMMPKQIRDMLLKPRNGQPTEFVNVLGDKVNPVVNSFASLEADPTEDLGGKSHRFSIKVKVFLSSVSRCGLRRRPAGAALAAFAPVFLLAFLVLFLRAAMAADQNFRERWSTSSSVDTVSSRCLSVRSRISCRAMPMWGMYFSM